MSVLGLAAFGILNYPEYVRQLLTVAIVNLPQRREERAGTPRTHKKNRDATASNHVVNLLPSINFDLVSCHIANYNTISN